ncbi:uncharacterized protein N7482_008072 [Penicillium canariense]|uniref:C2H2-type domain-containing protein n=1 Tax=Penicillium canariense TaxID=189055 RepID=A0A9W9LIE5_9EURO|nr:uncharacterized protein N7482_008072 [Penicillium canariense]KAJ5156972.1 hypothetical protein N7482_008072 [Penicillium canariense]
MTSDIYDSDDAMGRSPPPKPQEIKYESDEPPPPFVTSNDGDTKAQAQAQAQAQAHADTMGTPDRSRKPHLPETQTQTHLGDSVLISYLVPDRPDIAAHARDYPYSEWSPKQDRPPPLDWKQPPPPPSMDIDEGARGGKGTADGAGGGRKDTEVEQARARPPASTPAEKEAKLNPVVEQRGSQLHAQGKRDRETSLSPRNQPFPAILPPPAPPSDLKNDFVPPRQRPRLQSITAIPPVRRPSEDLLTRSPELGHRVSLPSLQSLSPPSSVAGTSPDSGHPNNKTLPSIQSALGGFSPSEFPSTRLNGLPPPYPYASCPGSATSSDSPHDRQLPRQFLPSHIPPTPFSQHLSPISAKDASNNPSPASQPSSAFWRGPPLPPPPPPPPAADTPHHAPTPYEMSPMTAKSPATSYPTPTEQLAPTPGSSERASFSSAVPVNGAGATGSYKCTHPGCTAAPFQTQYLLNSHANVHSQDRPHFCPVEGCPRALGGKGFKRKNEMMRHGLVHNSPGYVCPFCPDQQHKYPRPDNLQRHVRVHHVDKSKDDPILRQVLAQRPAGSTRGRRRRMNSG